jgi:hypothetical protein
VAWVCGRDVINITKINDITTTERQQERQWRRKQEGGGGGVVAWVELAVEEGHGWEACWLVWLGPGWGNFGSLCSSSFSPAIVSNSQFTARDSFFASQSFVSFPKMFALQKGRRERSQQEKDGVCVWGGGGREEGGGGLLPIDDPVGLPGEILLLRDASVVVWFQRTKIKQHVQFLISWANALRFQKDFGAKSKSIVNEKLSEKPQQTRRALGLGLLQQDHELRMILHKDLREGELDLDLPEQAREREDAEGKGEGSVSGGMR